MTSLNDSTILLGLKNKNAGSINLLYKEYYHPVRFFVCSNKGNDEDAEDLFQDALCVVYEKMQKDNFLLSCTLKTYLFSICRHLWLQRLEKRNKLTLTYEILDDCSPLALHDGNDFPDEHQLEKERLYQYHFLNLPEDCQKIIRLFLDKIPFKEIAKLMGLKSEHYAKTRKYMCKGMLRKRILNDPKCQSFIKNA